MKKLLIVLIALFAVVAFVSGAVAQDKKADKPAAAAGEKAKADKPKAPKAMKFAGAVVALKAGEMIKVKGAKDKEMEFTVTPDTKIKGEVKEGGRVTVWYKKEGDKMVATSITVPAPKPKKEAKPKEEKKS